MSVISKNLQTEIFHGLGAPESQVGSIPVLLGSKLIKDPQIIYARTNKLPVNPRVIPAVDRQPSLKQDTAASGIRQWAVVVALCYGILDKCQGIYCNGTRIYASKGTDDQTGDLLLDTTDRESNFEDNDFFGDGEPLEGFCFVLPGLPTVANDLYSRVRYLREWRAKLVAQGKNADTDNLLTPPDGAIAYNGLALAHVYTFEQSSESLNSWSFFCSRFPQQTWDPTRHKIKLLDDEITVTRGGETRARDHVLAIDCSPINGMAVDLTQGEGPIRDRPYRRTYLVNDGAVQRTQSDVSHTWGLFKYRYDIIRDGAVRALQNFKEKLDQSRSRVTYKFTLRVILFTVRTGGISLRTGPFTQVEVLQLPTYRDREGNMVTPITDKTDDKFGLFEGDTADIDTINNFIVEMQVALLNHDWLRPTPSPVDFTDKHIREWLPEEKGEKKIAPDTLTIEKWREKFFEPEKKSSWYFQNSPTDWHRLWVSPTIAVNEDRNLWRDTRFGLWPRLRNLGRYGVRPVLALLRFIRGSYQNTPRDQAVQKQSERICWAPINPFYHPLSERMEWANAAPSGWLAYFAQFYTQFFRFPGMRLRIPIGRDRLQIIEAIGVVGDWDWRNTLLPQETFHQHNRHYVPILTYTKADLYVVFQYVLSRFPEFQNDNLSLDRLPQLNFILGPNWPGRLQCLDVPLTGGDWYSRRNKNDQLLVGGFLGSTFPTVSDIYRMSEFEDVVGEGNAPLFQGGPDAKIKPLRHRDRAAWSYTNQYNATPFKDRLKNLLKSSYRVTPGAPAGDFAMNDQLANLYWPTGDRKVNWDFALLDPFVWGSNDKFRFKTTRFTGHAFDVVDYDFDPDKAVVRANQSTDNYTVANSDVFNVLDGLHRGNDNPHPSEDADYAPFEPYKAGESSSTRVWPQRGDTWPAGRIFYTEDQMKRYVLNTVASTDASPENALGSIGNRMGAVRTKSREETVRQVIEGANPVHIIRDCLLNEEWGCGRGGVIQESDLDNASFLAASKILGPNNIDTDNPSSKENGENMGLGFLWDRKSPIEEFLADVLRHIDGVLYEIDRVIYLRLFGKREHDNVNGHYRNPVAMEEEEFTEAESNVFDESNISAIEDIRVPRESELYNRVVINYTSYGASVKTNLSQSNAEHITKYGLKAKTISYEGIIDFSVANKILTRDMIIEEAGLYACTLSVLPEAAASIRPGSLIQVAYKKFQIEKLFMRVLAITVGDTRSTRVRLKCIQAHKGLVETR